MAAPAIGSERLALYPAEAADLRGRRMSCSEGFQQYSGLREGRLVGEGLPCRSRLCYSKDKHRCEVWGTSTRGTRTWVLVPLVGSTTRKKHMAIRQATRGVAPPSTSNRRKIKTVVSLHTLEAGTAFDGPQLPQARRGRAPRDPGLPPRNVPRGVGTNCRN